jgi:hypothetical protein
VALLTLLIADWKPYRKHHEAFTLAAGLAVAGVTLMRHFAQTDADRLFRVALVRRCRPGGTWWFA